MVAQTIEISDQFSNGKRPFGQNGGSICSQVCLVQISSHPVFKCLGPAKNDHLNTRLIRYSDPRCSSNKSAIKKIIFIFNPLAKNSAYPEN
jgi:hypothetical protein